jgi:hypothetical protein
MTILTPALGEDAGPAMYPRFGKIIVIGRMGVSIVVRGYAHLAADHPATPAERLGA